MSWSSWYETPTETVYSYNPSTNSYYEPSNLSPYDSYYTWNSITNTWESYEPTPITWTSYWETPSVSLYTYDEVHCNWTEESSPSPLISYYYWSEPSSTYETYVPTAPSWTDYWEPTTEVLYTVTPSEEYVSVPSESWNPYTQYYVWSEETSSYAPYTPTPVSWNSFYAEPSTEIYYYDVPTNSYVLESSPSPYETYYYWDESSQSVSEYVPTPSESAWVSTTTISAPSEESVSPYAWWTIGTPVYFEEPSVTLYNWDECTSTYYPIETPTWSEQHYYYSPETSTYEEYYPSAPSWTTMWEPSYTPLYSWSEETQTYTEVETPSPYESYYYYQTATESYLPYTPTAVSWTTYYEPSSVTLFSYSESTNTYSPVETPSPYVSYYWYNTVTSTFEPYTPTEATWSNYYETPSSTLYSWNESTQTYDEESSPSPYSTYYVWDSYTQNYFTYTPTEISWSNHYSVPSETLYTWEPSTSTYTAVSYEELSPSESYWTWNSYTQTYVPYTPTSVESTTEQALCAAW